MSGVIHKTYSRLNGSIFNMFRTGTVHMKPHPLDVRRDQYQKVLEKYIFPIVYNLGSDVPGYRERMEKIFTYSFPPFTDAWNFNVELFYQFVADEAHQTEDNMVKTQILRGLMDVVLTSTGIADDLSDDPGLRKGKTCWHHVCEGGEPAAIFDTGVLGCAPYVILNDYFHDHPSYHLLMDATTYQNVKLMIGQTLDVLSHRNPSLSMDRYRAVSENKTGVFFQAGVVFGLIHGGITDKDLLQEARHVSNSIGMLVQIWDDFCDYYCTIEAAGKPSCDIKNAGITWLCVTALELFNDAQAKEFKECYGTSDPEKIRRVYSLYEEINMTDRYVQHMATQYVHHKQLISMLPHPGIQEALYSWLDDLIGPDVLQFAKCT